MTADPPHACGRAAPERGPAAISFGLVTPSRAGNVGAATRSLAAFGFSAPLIFAAQYAPSDGDRALAAGPGRDPLARLRCVAPAETDRQLARFDEIWGTSDVRGAQRQAETPARAARTYRRQGGRLLILCGPERDGLDRDWLDRCHRLVRIPTSAGPLNLAHAVTVLAYELQRSGGAAADAAGARAAVAAEERRRLLARAEQILARLDYPSRELPRHPPHLTLRALRSAALTRAQARWLWGLMQRIEERLGNPSGRQTSRD